MCTLFESPVNPMVAVLYKECKEECKFTAKSDSDFLLFLLNSAVRILNVVKDFSPLLDVSQGCSSPDPVDKSQCSLNETSSAESGFVEKRISDYEDLLLDKIERSSDIETLQKYIDKVQSSLEKMSSLDESQEQQPDELESSENHDAVCEQLEDTSMNDLGRHTPTGEMAECENADLTNGSVTQQEAILSDAITEILNKTNFEEDLRELARINSSVSTSDDHLFSCSLCLTQFKNQRNLSRHIRLGVCLQKSFNCTLCDHSFATEYGLKRHLSRTMCKKRAMEENLSASPTKVPKLETCTQFVCDKCNFSFATKAALTQHVSSTKCDNNRLQGLTPKETKPPGFFECPHCKSTLASKAGLAKHLKRAQCRVYQCPDCAKSFRYLHEVRAHRRLEHKCTDEINTAVAQTFFNKMGGVPSMTYTSSILNTISSIPFLKASQLDIATHRCKVCSYAGTCKRSLENHMRMHVRQLKAIGENTQCTQCDFTCSEQNVLLKHYINNHPGLPYFKMAPKGTFIVRSNRISEVTTTNGPTMTKSLESDTHSASEDPLPDAAEDDNGETAESNTLDTDSKLEPDVPLTDLVNGETDHEVDCVSLNSQTFRESCREVENEGIVLDSV